MNLVPYINIRVSSGRVSASSATPDKGLMEWLGGSAFPYCVLMDSKGQILWECRPSGPATFARGVRASRLMLELRAAEKLNPESKAHRAGTSLLASLGCQQRHGLGRPREELLSATPDLDPRVLEFFEEERLESHIIKVMQSFGRNESKIAKTFYDLQVQGKHPLSESRFGLAFYYYASRGALDAKDLRRAEASLKKFKALTETAKPSLRPALEKDVKQLSERFDALSKSATALGKKSASEPASQNVGK